MNRSLLHHLRVALVSQVPFAPLGAGKAGAQDGFGSTGESGVLFSQVPALFAVDLGGLWGCSWA